MATKKMLTIPGQDLVLPTQLPGDVTPKRMIGNPTFTPDGKQITGGSGVTYSLKDMGGQNTPYTTTEVVGVKGGPAPSSESLDSILASNKQAMQRASIPSASNVSGNKNTVIPNTKLLAQSGGQSDSLPGAISPEDRIPGVYYPTPLPTPNTPTPTNPVTKISLQKAVPIAPDIAQIQQMDINNLNDTIDKLQIKQSKEQLSDEELLTLRRATRQLQQSMTPQSLTGGLDEMIAKKETNITETTNKLDKQNEQELAQFKQSQEVYKQAELQAIEQADEEQKKTLGYILGAQGAGTSSYGAEQINKITQNSLQKKQYLTQAIQAKIDLYGSQLRKDSQETIQNLQTNLDNLYMKAAEFDVENIKELNAFNKEQGVSKIKEIDDMIAFAQQQQKLALPLTEAEKQQAQAFAGNIYDNEGNFDDKTFELLQKINPKLAMEAVLQGGSIQKERMSNDLAMKGLDADIKRAQLNKLLNPAKEYEYIKDADGNTIAVAKDNPNERINITGGGEGLGDMRNLASQFPGQARAKNNNPAGITWNANFDNPKPGTTAYALQQAGVNFEKGTPRPGNEGGNYVTFPTMEDGLAAQRIMMTQTYGNTTVGNMLAKWVGTGEGPRYAQQVAGMAGVDINAIVNQLSDSQLQTLQMAKIQKESPGLAKILQQQTQGQDNNLTMQAQALVSGIGGTKEERADLVSNIVKIAQTEGITVQEAKAKLGLRSKTDDDFINVRTKDRDKTQEAGKALTQVKGAIQALNNPNPTTDLIGIVGLLKSIDPTSVARSDEVQNVKKAAGVLEAAQTQLKSWKSGDLLSPKQRVQLQEAMQTIVDAYDRKTSTDRNQIVKDFDKRGIDPNIIFGTNEIEGSRSGIANDLALQAGGATQATNTPQRTIQAKAPR